MKQTDSSGRRPEVSLCVSVLSETVFMLAGIPEVAPTPVYQPQYSIGRSDVWQSWRNALHQCDEAP